MTDLLAFMEQLRSAFCLETSELPHLWTADNPSIGQCHVASLAIQDHFGGQVVEGVVSTEAGDFGHFWLDFDGVEVDATADQFWGNTNRTGALPTGAPLKITRQKADLLLTLAFPAGVAA